MRRAFALVLVVGVGSIVMARGADADQTPDAGHYDSRMRYVAYNPSQVVHLSTIIGATMVVSFAPDETVTSVAETDSLHLAAVPKGNYLFLKPSAALKLQPIIVLTQRQDGALRRYVFEIETVDAPSTADGAAGIFYSVQFTYPADAAKAAAARAAADAKKVAALNRLALARATQTAAQSALQNEQTNPYAGPRNYKYVAKGDRSLAPLAVWDNGYSTLLQFAGNARIPSIFVIDPDGKEATASYAVSGYIVQLDQTAREWRLRDGGTVLDIYNLGYQSVGGNPETGTTSPDVSRVVVPPGSSLPGAKP
ncbi:TrbG/VirB9 family P-type conjugative transfer protein [Acidocella aminolytica]|uniref:Secretion system type IV protein VirB9/conjugal transfer protein n=1 Tax=Acidocella aminolytica 101 = DSM 11237 TaxID=1120923 RepID=A0A0D6PKV2_9PROT|nr:TrbG/VirB9 family P-type conjugative transfer protein [Acidocella aminolytica]GAN82297.1 secretion system type IV protein VirB9/conjugal transfer protein [Acidocella aminolytica 101 = DSM 11237]GBQ42462.1 transport secretion system IV VirB9 protein [Acidocella aminolytica 101 = DSM 11237]SHF38749.1 type IV secretion system protein VirB9 [Acidocella aminolytica 101 = DSM 11237]